MAATALARDIRFASRLRLAQSRSRGRYCRSDRGNALPCRSNCNTLWCRSTWVAGGGRQVGRGVAEAGPGPRGEGRRGGGGERQVGARALVHGGRSPGLSFHAVCWYWNGDH